MSAPLAAKVSPRGARGPIGLDIDAIRADFPILKQRMHGKPLVYLDNGASTQKPRSVITAIDRFYERTNANTFDPAPMKETAK